MVSKGVSPLVGYGAKPHAKSNRARSKSPLYSKYARFAIPLAVGASPTAALEAAQIISPEAGVSL